MEWQDRRVVVTGAANGIGKALSARAAASGARVAMVDVRAEDAAAAAEAVGPAARAFACHVASPGAVDPLAAEIVAWLGGIDAVFSNAGVGVGGKVEDLSAGDAAWVISVNLVGLINVARAFIPHLRRAAGEGREAWLVNTGSEHSLGIPTIGASNVYTATKHAALGLTDAIRSDLAGSGVRAALLCPGLVATNIYDAKAVRPDSFGGPQLLPAEHRERAMAFMTAKGQSPDLTAELCFEGLDRGDFLIITDPEVGQFVQPRIAELAGAVETVERRLADHSVAVG